MIDHRAISKKLSKLWDITKEDWSVTISFSLTEPYAPVCVIVPDGGNTTRYTAWGNTVEEAVNKAVESVYQEVIVGNKIAPEAPFTNPDDHKPKPWQPE